MLAIRQLEHRLQLLPTEFCPLHNVGRNPAVTFIRTDSHVLYTIATPGPAPDCNLKPRSGCRICEYGARFYYLDRPYSAHMVCWSSLIVLFGREGTRSTLHLQ